MNQEEAVLKSEPGNPIFAEYAENLRASGNLGQAMDVCLAGLSANPGCHRGRLVLARVFYEKRYIPFAVQELERIHLDLPENKSVAKLLEKFGAWVSSADSAKKESVQESNFSEQKNQMDSTNPSGTMAEAEFDFDVLDEIEEESKK